MQVAARCLETAVQGAGHNVDINLKDITVTGVRNLLLILYRSQEPLSDPRQQSGTSS